MRGVVMEVKGRYAVLLNKSGEFVRVRNKNYTVGQTVTITNNTSRICAVAASMLIVCGGIGSYFTPAGYVSVDINPSLLLTLNVYNKVIDVKALNDDAVVLLEETDVKGMSIEKSVDELIETSKQVGYINENNKDVIVEVASGVRKIEIAERTDAEMVVEDAEKADLTDAKKMGISIAKVKAIKDYAKANDANVAETAEKLADKSAKEIRRLLEMTPEEVSPSTPVPAIKAETAREPTKPSDNKAKPVVTYVGNNLQVSVEEDAVAEMKPQISVEEVFKVPTPYYEPSKPVIKDEVKTEADIENADNATDNTTTPNHFIPSITQKPAEGKEENDDSKPSWNHGGNPHINKDKDSDSKVEIKWDDKSDEKQEEENKDDTQNSPAVDSSDKYEAERPSFDNVPSFNERPNHQNSSEPDKNTSSDSANDAPVVNNRPQSGNPWQSDRNDGYGADKSEGSSNNAPSKNDSTSGSIPSRGENTSHTAPSRGEGNSHTAPSRGENVQNGSADRGSGSDSSSRGEANSERGSFGGFGGFENGRGER